MMTGTAAAVRRRVAMLPTVSAVVAAVAVLLLTLSQPAAAAVSMMVVTLAMRRQAQGASVAAAAACTPTPSATPMAVMVTLQGQRRRQMLGGRGLLVLSAVVLLVRAAAIAPQVLSWHLPACNEVVAGGGPVASQLVQALAAAPGHASARQSLLRCCVAGPASRLLRTGLLQRRARCGVRATCRIIMTSTMAGTPLLRDRWR